MAHAITPQTAVDATEVLVTRADARYLRVPDRTVAGLIRASKLPASSIGRSIHISQSDLLDMLNRNPSILNGLGVCRD
jgi:excisionase family DNA binding protein